MRILVISQFFAPDITAAAFRMCETVDLLKQEGHSVRVITSAPHKGGLQQVDEAEDLRQGIYRVPVSAIQGGGMRRYLQHYMSFMARSLWAGIKQRFGSWRPDVVWASAPPLFVGITGRSLAAIFGCPLVFDVRDIWPQSAVSAGQLSATGRAFKAGRTLEKSLYKAADHITCVSQPMAAYISSQCRTPVSVIYNGLAADFDQPLAGEKSQIKKRILYAGNFGRVQGLDALISSFSAALAEGAMKDWTLAFIGGGAMESELRASALHLGDRVTFGPPVSKKQIMVEMANSAALVINLRADSVLELTIPSKVFDYMGAGRPILYGIVGEGADILARTGANVAFRPSDMHTFKQALYELDRNYAALDAAASSNPQAVSGLYSREYNTRKLAGIFEKLKGTASS